MERRRPHRHRAPGRRLWEELVARRLDRLGYLATLALPDVDAALVEIRRGYDDLGIDGVCLRSNFEGIYLGDARFIPI